MAFHLASAVRNGAVGWGSGEDAQEHDDKCFLNEPCKEYSRAAYKLRVNSQKNWKAQLFDWLPLFLYFQVSD